MLDFDYQELEEGADLTDSEELIDALFFSETTAMWFDLYA